MTERIGGLGLLWLSNIAALWAASRLLDGFDHTSTRALFVGGAVLALVNWLVRPVVTVLAFPLILVTLGLAYLLIGALMLYLMATLTDGFTASGASWLWAALIVGVVNAILRPLLGVERSGKRRSGRGRDR